MRHYVEVAYDQNEKPFGEYPLQLAAYLVDRFQIKPGMKILDNGCGRGEFLHAFSACGLEVSGTDLSDYCKEAEVLDLNRDRLPFEDGCFDVVFSKSVIEHIEDTEHYMGEMRRVLKQGGLLLLMAPDWKTQYKIFFDDPTHIHPYTCKSLEKLLRMEDFKEAGAEQFCQLPVLWGNIQGRGYFARMASKLLRMTGPVGKIHKNKFIRFSKELMVLAYGKK